MTAIFIHIPKTGGMSIQEALSLQQYRNRRKLAQGREYSGLVTFGHELLPYLQRRGLAPRDVFTFSFVRNPYDRAVSLWAYFRQQYNTDIGFTEWCRNIGAYTWRIRYPQARWLDGLTVDFVGRFEILQRDFDRLCVLLSVPQSNLPHLNQSEHGARQDHYTDEARAIIRAHYARDFAELGYENDCLPN